MSQSDYILHKRLTVELKNQYELNPVLDSALYTLSKQYSVSNLIVNNNITYNQLASPILPNYIIDPTFIINKNTNNRPNRIQSINTMFNFQQTYIKQKIRHKTFNCCYNSRYNLTHTNNANALLSTCSNRRKNALLCNQECLIEEN